MGKSASEKLIRGFGSDNHSGVHPEIWEALRSAEGGHAPSYGTDRITSEVNELFRNVFSPKAHPFFVFNGTAANVLALKTLTKSYHSVICSDDAHLHMDECGSPEMLGHVKLWPLPAREGKISLQQIQNSLIRRGDQHFSQQKVISLAQPTELGTVYQVQELREIVQWAHEQGLKVHIDGARFANAVVHLKTSFRDLIKETQIDALSFGGTKNGLLFGEAVVVFDEALAEDLKFYRKQLGQLPSKTRFVAAQFRAYLSHDLWKRIAEHSLNSAQELFQVTKSIPGVRVTRPVQSNAVFAEIPQEWIKKLKEKYFFYVWNEKTYECRWMTSWDTQSEEIQGFAHALQELSR